ncbi:MAG: PHP domain-containing protein [Lacrimispora sp.]|uniref:PHP domain-containing protein n=1 Tax=Lacrimispora sp. TaxID=2719234 RepID=UPI0039E3F698
MNDRIYLLPEKGRFYKANLHGHTTESDGRLTPEEAKAGYKNRGYQVAAYTDHRVYKNHEELNDEGFLAIAAVEVDINQVGPDQLRPRDKTYHINLYDTRPEHQRERKEGGICPECRYGDFDYINTYLKEMKELGFISCYNHPYWSLQNYEDYKGLNGLFAMEVYNHGCENDGLYGYNPQSYDEMLRLGKRLWCLATDDNHNSYPFEHPLCDSFGGFTMIKAEEFTYSGIMDSLVKGHFYSSMGPEIRELYIEGKELVVKTSPVQAICKITENTRSCDRGTIQGGAVTEARFPVSANETYIRVECRDEKGLFANSNAYFLSDIGFEKTGD